MRPMIIAALLALSLTRAPGATPPRTVPGPQDDGSMLLHSQWPIRPAGRQVPLGDFPAALAVDPSGRYAAVLHAGYLAHAVHVIDVEGARTVAAVPVHEAFEGICFSADGRRVLCSGGSDSVVHRFALDEGRLRPLPDLRVAPADRVGVVAGIAVNAPGTVFAVRLFDNDVIAVDEASGVRRWRTLLPGGPDQAAPGLGDLAAAGPNEATRQRPLVTGAQPLCVAADPSGGRVYASLWGRSQVAVLDAASGRIEALWDCGLHPNELLLSRDGRLFVSNGGLNAVTVLSTADGRALEVLSSAMDAGDPPGSTPDSLALSRDGRTLYVANASNNNVAVFDVSRPGSARPLGFIPTGWYPTGVRLAADDRRLLVLSARGVRSRPNGSANPRRWPRIASLFPGELGIVRLPPPDGMGAALEEWTRVALACRPAPSVPPARAESNPIPARPGDPTPIRYVIYVIKENRTYDQVFGDMPPGNGDPSLCLFPEKVTPNLHAIARRFVLLDNLYANSEISASGHDWSTAAYCSEFIERLWPVNYGHRGTNTPYPGEGGYLAAVPASGYLWDRAKAAGLTYESFGEFARPGLKAGELVVSNMPALAGHIDPEYAPWDLSFRDTSRIDRFIAELHRREAAGDMPRLQLVRLPNDHTAGGKAGARTPAAMVADNDLAVGRLVEAVSRSRFWPQTAIFIIEDDAQDGPDHVDAHRTEALVASPYTRRGTVDSTPYTTCSMLHTIELILGLGPMSQFDARAVPMWASFQGAPDTTPYACRPPGTDLDARNPRRTRAAMLSERLDLSREDANDDRFFNEVIWETVRGGEEPFPAAVRAAFVRPAAAAATGVDDDGDGD
jgi:DNA-binding beta-propeller fold protein YncE